MRLCRRQLLFAASMAALLPPRLLRAEGAAVHGIAMHGDLRYGPDFTHFDYVNPDAPKGGSLSLSAIGTFDSMNPFILRGTPAAGIGLAFETLTVQSFDEPFSEYGLIARTIEVPAIEISATEIRRRVREGRSIRYWVPDPVAEYVTSHRLYLDPA